MKSKEEMDEPVNYFKKVANNFEWTLDEREEIQKLLNHQHQVTIDKVVKIIQNEQKRLKLVAQNYHNDRTALRMSENLDGLLTQIKSLKY